MEQVPVQGGTLESVATGSGEPVLFVHGSIFADAFAPLRSENALVDRYRLITYNRRGFGGSVRHTGPCSIADQAMDARAVLEHYGVKKGHIVGHSYGCRIAVELALTTPQIVATLTLAEPGGPPTPTAAEFGAGLQEIASIWKTGDKTATLNAFIRFISGDHPQARANLDARLPNGWYETALADLDGFFEVEFPTRAPFGEHEASQLTMPSLAVGGTDSLPFFRDSYKWLLAHLPGVERLELTGATHGLQLDDPSAFAAGLTTFLDCHPIHP